MDACVLPPSVSHRAPLCAASEGVGWDRADPGPRFRSGSRKPCGTSPTPRALEFGLRSAARVLACARRAPTLAVGERWRDAPYARESHSAPRFRLPPAGVGLLIGTSVAVSVEAS